MTSKKSYYAVIFTSRHSDDISGYDEMAQKMVLLAMEQDGFLGMESARDDIGITVSYWQSLEAIKRWKLNSEHLVTQEKGRNHWYNWYHVRICKVEREYEFKST